MTLTADLKKTLTQLENRDWGKVSEDAPPYLKTVYELRYKPIRELSIGDLQLLISQQVGLKYLMPVAVSVLQKQPLVEGRYYCGDLLHSVLTVSANETKGHPSLFDMKPMLE